MASSNSRINVFICYIAGQKNQISLPIPFTLADFKQAIRVTGDSCDNYRFVVSARQIDLTDEDRFNQIKEKITNNSTIFGFPLMRGGCFLKNTSILLSDGTEKMIGEIQIGDSLLAFNVLGEIVITSVEKVFVHDVDEYIELNTGRNLLCVTQEHPFFIGNGSFCPLKKLHINDCIYNLVNGSLQSTPIMSMKTIVAPATQVYNLRTTEPHTYFANNIAVHNKFGVEFVDLSNTTGLQRLGWSSSGPSWYTAHHGLCLEGKCTNASCEAHRQTVIINLGFRRFDLLADATADTSKCPACGRYVEPKTCAFNNCQWRWSGVKQPQSGMPPENVAADWKTADDAYHRFDQDVSGTVVWRKLIIETRKN